MYNKSTFKSKRWQDKAGSVCVGTCSNVGQSVADTTAVVPHSSATLWLGADLWQLLLSYKSEQYRGKQALHLKHSLSSFVVVEYLRIVMMMMVMIDSSSSSAFPAISLGSPFLGVRFLCLWLFLIQPYSHIPSSWMNIWWWFFGHLLFDFWVPAVFFVIAVTKTGTMTSFHPLKFWSLIRRISSSCKTGIMSL